MEGESYVPRAEGEYTRGSHSSPRAPRCLGMRPAPDLLPSRRPLRTSQQRSPTGDSTVRACVRPNNVQPSTPTVGDSQESLNLVLSESRALAIRRYACMGRPGLDSDTVQRQRISEMGERNAHTRHIGIYSKTHRPASNRPWPDDRQESSGFSTRLSEAARAPVPPTRVCTEIP